MRIAVAMSGGVDSSVAAHILKERGHEVVGLTMRVRPCGEDFESDGRACCDEESIRDAARVAEYLGIRHYELGVPDEFDRAIVRHFVREYALGRTPNPCVRCNRLIKFGPLLAKAAAIGASHLATGHHASVRFDEKAGGYVLLKGRDSTKDQSYFLHSLNQKQLSRTLMPIGDLTKSEVREMARVSGLHVSERTESQDVCFVPRGDIASLFARVFPDALRPGPIEDSSGRVLGEHRGIALYTVGQRSGLGLSRPRPTYVLRIDAGRNAIIVGDDADLYSSALTASGATWIAGEPPATSFRAEARIRYAAKPVACAVEIESTDLSVEFDEPQRAIAPGQSVVFYHGERVLGGAEIE